MTVSTQEYLAAARTFPTGVTVVATRYRGGFHAKTVSAFTSLSLDPLLVGVAIGRRSPMVWATQASGVLSVNVLRHDQRRVAEYFAAPSDRRDLPPPVALSREDTGAPVLGDCLSWLDCRVAGVVRSGDHALILGRVVAVRSGEGRPLVHQGGAYHALSQEQELRS
ncbi:flavin reductase family protein [Streptomyces sp. NPDC059166]|uniref:flavin reductase family protein n=1 Tax=Streptomyces sp. NPDC059166 TaxID=3346752 RepID=UPI0036B66FE5